MRFKKGDKPKNGFDKRPQHINKFGRPKDHSKLRSLIQRIAFEATASDATRTEIEAMLRDMMKSKSAADRKEIIEHGWGKVPDEVNLNIKDVDAAIERQLARVAARSQTANAGEVASDGHTSEAEA